MTVESALILSITLLVFAAVLLLAIRMSQEVKQEASLFLSQQGRYQDSLRPADLIHIGEFIAEWIQPQK